MSTDTRGRAGARDVFDTAHQTRLRTPRRRRPALIVLAVALIALGGLTDAVVLANRADRVTVLATARRIEVGHQITDADVREVDVVPDARLRPVPAADRSTVVGGFAAVGLPAGTLVVEGAVSAQRVPGPGQALVGVAVGADRMPARDLAPGDLVLVVPTNDTDNPNTASAGSGSSPRGVSVRARVVEVSEPDASTGKVTVDLAVDEDAAVGLASAGAAGGLALVLLGEGDRGGS